MKGNRQYYLDILLSQKCYLLSNTVQQKLFNFFIEKSTSVHCACITFQLLQQKTLNFIVPELHLPPPQQSSAEPHWLQDFKIYTAA